VSPPRGPGRRGRWFLIGLAGLALVGGLIAPTGTRVVLESQPSRARALDLLGPGVSAQEVRAEAPGLTQIDFTITATQPGPPPGFRFQLREIPDGLVRVDVHLTPLLPGRAGYVTVRFPPQPPAPHGAYEFSLQREDAPGLPGFQIWGSDHDAYPAGVYRRNGLPVADGDMTFLASFHMRPAAALGVLAQRLTVRRPAPWNWPGTYVILLLVYGGALSALLAGLARMATTEPPGTQ
jgi:hypothetical protein